MSRLQFFEDVALGDVQADDDGFRRADAVLARTGIQIYSGSEIPAAGLDRVRVYRPAEEVFARDALRSLRMKPITIDHPPDFVSAADEPRVVGWTGDDIRSDGQLVRARIVFTKPAAFTALDAGVRQLSVGYFADIVLSPGLTPEGEPFDAVQRNIRANHVALVREGRCGEACRVEDLVMADACCGQCEKGRSVSEFKAEIDVKSLEEARRVIDAKERALSDIRSKLIQLEADVERTMDRHQAALKARDAEIASLRERMSDAKVADEAMKLLATWAAAGPILPADYKFAERSRTQVMTDCLIRLTQNKRIADEKTPEQIEAMFTVAMAKPDLVDRSVGGIYADAIQRPTGAGRYAEHLRSAYAASQVQ